MEIGARRFYSSWGRSTKQAELQAALEALLELELVDQGPDGEVRIRREGVQPPISENSLQDFDD